jgi:hypothetical protein
MNRRMQGRVKLYANADNSHRGGWLASGRHLMGRPSVVSAHAAGAAPPKREAVATCCECKASLPLAAASALALCVAGRCKANTSNHSKYSTPHITSHSPTRGGAAAAKQHGQHIVSVLALLRLQQGAAGSSTPGSTGRRACWCTAKAARAAVPQRTVAVPLAAPLAGYTHSAAFTATTIVPPSAPPPAPPSVPTAY